VYDVMKAREGDWEQRSKALLSIAAGKGKSGLGYDDLMKIFVQLIDPEDVFAEFNVSTRKKVKGEKDIASRYLLNKDKNGPLLRERTQLKERFAEPSLLAD
jgi:hypothetical protein